MRGTRREANPDGVKPLKLRAHLLQQLTSPHCMPTARQGWPCGLQVRATSVASTNTADLWTCTLSCAQRTQRTERPSLSSRSMGEGRAHG